MSLRIQSFLTGVFALIAAFLLALAPASANPASGGYQLFEQAASGHQTDIQLASLGNFNYHAKTASECCTATNRVSVPDDLPTNIHMGGQGKHVPGHNNFDPTRSTLTADPQDLLAGVHSGQYPIIRSIPRGNSTSNIVDFGRPIGDFRTDGVLVGPTQYGQIVQSKHGAHIIPANPNQY